MARIRSIKPSFAGDSKVARLSLPARLTFLLLLPECDDDGRMVASPKRLAGVLFPNDDAIGPRQVEKWIAELEREQMVTTYDHDGTRYLSVPKFRLHQSPQHPKPSVLPPPPGVNDSGAAHEVVMTTAGTDHETVIPDLNGSRRGVGEGVLASAPPSPEKPRSPDRLWDAVMAACGIHAADITPSSRGAYNRAVGDLRALDVDPAEVCDRAAAFRLRWPEASLTPPALARHWAECAPSAALQPVIGKGQAALLRAQARG